MFSEAMDFAQPGDHCLHIMQKMYEMRDQPTLCDLSIVVGSKMYWAHKYVLVAACPTLHDIVLNESESGLCENLQLTLQGLTCEGFEALLKYIYTGIPPFERDSQLFQDFKKACRALGVPGIPQSDTFDCHQNAPQSDTCNKEETDELVHSSSQLVVEVITSLNEVENKQFEAVSDILECVDMNAVDLHGFHTNPSIDGEVVSIGSTDQVNKGSVRYPNEAIHPSQNIQGANAGSTDGFQPIDDIVAHSNDESNVLDISALFSVKKRARNSENEKVMEVAVSATAPGDSETPNDSKVDDLALIRPKTRGRPRLPNDHIFPMKPPFVCPHQGCIKVCESREKLKKHYRNHDEKTHQCDICGRKFLYKKDVIIHKRIHTGEKPYECVTCGMSFTQKCVLTNHFQTHLSGQKFPCSHCNRSYTSARSLSLHMRETHGQRNRHKPACGMCGETYLNDGFCLIHKENGCSDAAHVCLMCGHQFNPEELLAHVKACRARSKKAKAHSRAAEFKCAHCQMTFNSKRTVMNHIQFSHDIYPMKEEDYIAVVNPPHAEVSQKFPVIDFSKIMFEELVDSDAVSGNNMDES